MRLCYNIEGELNQKTSEDGDNLKITRVNGVVDIAPKELKLILKASKYNKEVNNLISEFVKQN